MIRIKIFLVIIVSLVLFKACCLFPSVYPLNIVIDQVINLTIGGTATISIKIEPDNTSDKTVSWIIDDISLVSIDNAGKVTGKKEGITKIRAKSISDPSVISNDCTITVGTITAQAKNPNPYNGQENVSISTSLSWENVSGAISYDVYFGKVPSPSSSEYKLNTQSIFYSPGTLSYKTTYYWKIDTKNKTGTTYGNIWYFTTQNIPQVAPDPVKNPNPFNGQTNVSINASLSWDNGGGATSYDVYFDNSLSPVKTSNTIFQPGTLQYNKTYYWHVSSINNIGTTPGSTWYFTTEVQPQQKPNKVINPDPYNSQTDVSISSDINWDDGGGADSYDIYFGTNSIPGSAESKGNQTSTYFTPELIYNKKYYWKINPKNNAGTTIGTIWNFTTVLDTYPPINGSIKINGSNTFTINRDVLLDISAYDLSGVSQIKISNDNSTWALYTYTTTISWTLLAGDGNKTVYIRFKDSVGNWNTSSYTDSISLDEYSTIKLTLNKYYAISKGDEIFLDDNIELYWVFGSPGYVIERARQNAVPIEIDEYYNVNEYVTFDKLNNGNGDFWVSLYPMEADALDPDDNLDDINICYEYNSSSRNWGSTDGRTSQQATSATNGTSIRVYWTVQRTDY